MEYIITDKDFSLFKKILQTNNDRYITFIFSLSNPIEFLRSFKYFLKRTKINLSLYDFTNLNEFVNFILDTWFYLPRNINLFFVWPCYNWCTFCDKKEDYISWYNSIINNWYKFLSLSMIKKFFSKYKVSKYTNINFSWEWDPILHPEFKDIVKYLKGLWFHLTLFLWWKSLLYSDVNFLDSYIDVFKLNLWASNYKIYNNIHLNKITEKEFKRLISLIKFLSSKHYVNIVSVVNKWNFYDIYYQYLLSLRLWSKSFEVKIDHEFPDNGILLDLKKKAFIIKLIKKMISESKINICSDFSADLTNYIYIPDIEKPTILDNVVQQYIMRWNDINKFSKFNICKQYGHSIYLNLDWWIYVCCIKEVGKAWCIDSDIPYYEQDIFKINKKKYSYKLPSMCSQCPLPNDRIKNIYKYFFCKAL